MKLLNPNKISNFSYSCIYSDAEFAAPLPGQGGFNWLWNRVATDTALLTGAGLEAMQGRLNVQKLKNMQNWRTNKLNALDARGVRQAYIKPTIDEAVNSFKNQMRSAPGYPKLKPGTTSSQIPLRARIYDDSIVEVSGRNYARYDEGGKIDKNLLDRPSLIDYATRNRML